MPRRCLTALPERTVSDGVFNRNDFFEGVALHAPGQLGVPALLVRVGRPWPPPAVAFLRRGFTRESWTCT